MEQLLRPLSQLYAPVWAEVLLREFGSLSSALAAEHEEIRSVVKSDAPAAHLQAIKSGMQLVLQEEATSGPLLSTSTALSNYLRLALGSEPVEQFRVFYLDARNRLLADVQLARGSVGSVIVSPREVVRRALTLGSTAIILIHNHPSGDATPSHEDIEVTHRVAKAAMIFDITVHDHLIVSKSTCVSMAALGYLEVLR